MIVLMVRQNLPHLIIPHILQLMSVSLQELGLVAFQQLTLYIMQATVKCGKARSYQKATTDAFSLHTSTKSIDGPYVDEISITLGSPRKHVWTYAVGITDDIDWGLWNCPCTAVPGAASHTFVGNDYYCESGTSGTQKSDIFTNDPLWDGGGFIHANNNCCANPSMPWFLRQFSLPHNEDIEVRLCRDEDYNNEATVIDQLQLYVL